MGIRDSIAAWRRRDPGVRWATPPAGTSAAIYQIHYSAQTRAALDPGFLPLDNSANRRPDWREYHPMRSFLLNAPLDEQRFYGFFSPKFGAKTRLSAAQVHGFLEAHAQADVALFSPFPELQAIFANTFLQGDHFHPGLMAVAEAFTGTLGLEVDLHALVTDSRRSVFSNYFAAKPRFWRAWLALNEALYRHAENRGPLHSLLNRPATYKAGEEVQFKIFLQERAADLVLATQPQWSAAAYPPEQLVTRAGDPALMLRLDRLKAAFADTGQAQPLAEWQALLRQHDLP